MITVVLVIHLMIAVAMIGVVLLQRSEGGALGIGGGGGGGFLSGRGTANLLTRATAVLAAGFFLTSISLTLLANQGRAPRSLFDGPAAPTTGATPGSPAAPTDGSAPPAPAGGGVLDDLKSGRGFAPLPTVPQN